MKTRKSANDEWRHLLKGGFAFETAPFAVHPCDKECAERMFFVAARAGVSKAAIVEAAEHYLRDVCKVNASMVMEEIERVRSFLSRYDFNRKAKHAWLVFWNSSELFVDNATTSLVQIFDPRMSERRICEFLEFHYRAVKYPPEELLYFATRANKNPCRSAKSKNRPLSYACGHDPWLEARFCYDIVICDTDRAEKRVCWSNTDTK